MGKGLKHFSPKDSQMAERCKLLVIWEANSDHKTALTPTRIAIILKWKITEGWQKCGEIGTFVHG